MIFVLQFVPLFVYGLWRMHQAAQARRAKTSDPQALHVTLAAGLEDDPVLWPADGGSWTALDERQLIRLLRDSAP